MIIPVLILQVLLAAASGCAQASGKAVFILAGQSNMAGRGGVARGRWDGGVPPECRPNPGILRFSAGRRWEPAHEPLHSDVDVGKTCGVGPGMPFAHAVLGASGVAAVGLVPCAAGGTKIARWARGSHLYDQMVERANAAVGDGGSVAALLWHQGESDTVTVADADSYRANMEDLIRNVRSDLGLPDLPVIQVALASGEGPYVDRVRAAQLSVNLPRVVTVDAQGLQLGPDHLHLTTSAQVQLGKKLADAFLGNFAL
ncbi:hypothetical protein H6P81_020505 [Aristolochia fimbriata]|uniref:Sialate O-acetylesterase domain-containing protein n=1 Tax=Aristolochia fimbriata TaxID=158543 RepID=A0AAV7DUN6_ARIFI|nr:hypothetical protein H6P81_020505 [Aristolochia fimbriata]